MAQSPEYSDLTWMPPKSWTNANRTSVQMVVIHTTEGSEGPASAEDGAAYDQRRTDGTSTHYFHDSNSTVQCVRTEDQAHAARPQGNRRGIQHELCGRAGQGSTGWADTISQGTLRQAAKQVARDCKKWVIPVRKLSAGQVASGMKGICGHVEITNAFPQDNGTHTDPGPTFPWAAFLALVHYFIEADEELPVDQSTFNKLLFTALKDPDVVQALRTSWTKTWLGKSGPNADIALQGAYGDAQAARALAVATKEQVEAIRVSVDALIARLQA